MRLHSPFKDYYDSALAYGADETLHFVRATGELTDAQNDMLHRLILGDQRNYKTRRKMYVSPLTYSFGYYLQIFVVGFCGRLYAGISFDGKYFYPEK